jgi:hypothetical protein
MTPVVELAKQIGEDVGDDAEGEAANVSVDVNGDVVNDEENLEELEQRGRTSFHGEILNVFAERLRAAASLAKCHVADLDISSRENMHMSLAAAEDYLRYDYNCLFVLFWPRSRRPFSSIVLQY